MEEKKKSRYCLFIPPVLTVLLLLLVYIIKGVYPFGTSNISYYDMNQSFIPGYCRGYEVFHGKDSLFFDWLEGAGMDMTSTFPTFILNPLDFFFWILKPDYALNFMAWFLMLKLIAISFSVSYYLKKNYDLSLIIHITLSMMYTFSGYIIQFYTNIWWLDTVALFPLIVLSIKYINQKGKTIPFFLLLSFELLTCQYMSIMVLLFVLFYSFGLSFTESDKVKRRVFVTRIGITTVTSLLVSSVLLIPVVLKWSDSSRTSGSIDILDLCGLSISTFQHQKVFMLFNTEIAVVISVLLILGSILKKEKIPRAIVFKLYIFVIMLMPVLNEGINLLWHMGSYVHFPFRCAFMLTFTGIDLIAYVRNEYGDDPIIRIQSNVKRFVVGKIVAMIVIASMVIGVNLYSTFFENGILGRTVSYYGLPELLIINVILYALVICFYNKKIRERVFCIVTMMHLTVASVCFIAPTDYSRQDDFSYYVMRDKFIKDSIEIRNSGKIENDYVSRIKTLYPCLSRNYPIILGIPSVNQWLNENSVSFLDELKMLGYDYNYTSNFDSGGTYFSDAILNNKKIIVYGDVYVPENAYKKFTASGDYTIYDMNYTLPFGMLTDEKICDTDCDDMTVAEHQIQLARAFSDGDSQIIKVVDPSDIELISSDEENKEYVYRYKLQTGARSLLYIGTNSSYNISVNDHEMFFPYFDETDNLRSQRPGKNGVNLVYGFDKDDEANIEIKLGSNKIERLQMILLDLDAMEKLSEKYENLSVETYEVGDNSLRMTVDVKENHYLFLPLEYLEGWHANVNGNDAEIIPVMNGAFMAIQLPDGHCEINMKYMPPAIIKGEAITLIGLAVALLLFVMKKRGKDVAEIPWLANVVSVVFNLVAVAVFVIMYILPVCN